MLKAPELNQMLLTFGIGIILQNLALLIWGGDPVSISNVPYRALGFQVGGVSVGAVPLFSFLISLVLVGGLYFVLIATPVGRAMRAVAQNRMGAALVGLEPDRIYLTAFALSAALAGLGGVMIAVIQSPTPTVGFAFTLKAFAIVVLAGLGKHPGHLVGLFNCGALRIARRHPRPQRRHTPQRGFFFAIIFVVLIARSRRLA